MICLRRVVAPSLLTCQVPVANYNDSYRPGFSRWPMKKVNQKDLDILRKNLSEHEPTEHDKALSEAHRFAMAEFRVQMRGLRALWRDMYKDLDENVDGAYVKQYQDDEKARSRFIAKLKRTQSAEFKNHFSNLNTENEIVSMDDEYRTPVDIDPDAEVEMFIADSKHFITPENIDDKLEELLNQDSPYFKDHFMTPSDEYKIFMDYHIEFALESDEAKPHSIES